MARIYKETFDRGPGGWWGFAGNHLGLQPLAWRRGTVTTRSPWWIDYNHAPPGAGYLHMLACLNVRGPFSDHHREVAGHNAFAEGAYPLDFRDARLRVRLRGEVRRRGAQLVLLLQGRRGAIISGWLLTGQPLEVTRRWSEQEVRLSPDPAQWTCLGARHDRGDYYGHIPLAAVLRDVNVNLMFVLFPLTVTPMGPLRGDPHRLRAGRDYPVWTSDLPEGYVEFDTVEFAFRGAGASRSRGESTGRTPRDAARGAV
jgi:hypothetical protein